MRNLTLLLFFLALALGPLVACTQPADDARSAWLQETLLEDNRNLLEREPDLSFRKFAKMARSRYEFLRGTSLVFSRDLQEPGAWPTAYVSDGSHEILLIGDAHPENLGTYRDGRGQLLLDFDDFDTANWGPFHWEVRRLAVGWAMAGLEIRGDATPEHLEEAVDLGRAVVEGYVFELAALADGAAPVQVLPRGGFGPVIDDAFERAREDGDLREELDDYTEIVDDQRRLRRGVLRLPDGVVPVRELRDISPRERRLVEELLLQWPETLHDRDALAWESFTVLDVRRRIGAGVSSLPIYRYYALIQGPSGDVDDVLLLDVKEARDGQNVPEILRYGRRPFSNNAERTVLLQRAFQAVPDADPYLGWVSDGALSFRVQHQTKYHKDIDVSRMVANVRARNWTWQHIRLTAYTAGRILARGHAQAPTASGQAALPILLSALGDDAEGFVTETTAFTTDYLPRLLADYQRFLDLLDREGPWLGYRFTHLGTAP